MQLPFLVILTSMEEPNPRRAAAVAHLRAALGAFETVDGPDASRYGYEARCLPLHPQAPGLLPGYRANAAAHAQAWAMLLRSDHGHALVLEDDARLLVPAPYLAGLLAALPDDYDWCRLDDGPAPPAEAPGVRPATDQWGTCAYLVSRAGAVYLLAHMLPQFATVDCLLHFRAPYRRAFTSNGSAFSPEPAFQSLILPSGLGAPLPD